MAMILRTSLRKMISSCCYSLILEEGLSRYDRCTGCHAELRTTHEGEVLAADLGIQNVRLCCVSRPIPCPRFIGILTASSRSTWKFFNRLGFCDIFLLGRKPGRHSRTLQL